MDRSRDPYRHTPPPLQNHLQKQVATDQFNLINAWKMQKTRVKSNLD